MPSPTSFRRLAPAAALAAAAVLGLCEVARAADPIYVEFFDASGTQIAGPVRVKGYAGSLEGLSFLHSWLRPTDATTGQATGPARLQGLEITVPIGPASPILINTLTHGFKLGRIVFHFVRSTFSGEEEFYRVTVMNANFVTRRMDLPDTRNPDNRNREATETYGFVYENVDIDDPHIIRQLLYLPGDANGDLVVDISDAVRLLGYLFLGDEMRCPLSGDVNGDAGHISDGVALLTFLFAGTRPPPPPFPQCGEVPTGKAIPCGISACEAGA